MDTAWPRYKVDSGQYRLQRGGAVALVSPRRSDFAKPTLSPGGKRNRGSLQKKKKKGVDAIDKEVLWQWLGKKGGASIRLNSGGE